MVHLKMLGMEYPIDVILMCLGVYIYMHAYMCICIAAQLKPLCIMHGCICWWGKVLGLGEKPEHFNIRKGTRLAWLPLLPTESWGLNDRYLWGFLSLTFTQRSGITDSCSCRLQVTTIHMKTNSESFIFVFSPVSVVFGRRVQVAYLDDSMGPNRM